MTKANPNVRAARRRSAAQGAPVVSVARINDLIRTAKAGWLGLLAYLAYVGVTLLGVIDADFFMPERQTELPLIGVSIPTNLFFWIAPALGAMLFAYMHLYLLKLWTALAEAPAQIDQSPLGDQIAPWLVADYALSHRLDSALRPAPLRRAANVVSLILVFAAAPLVLAGFWWRSMPKHDEVLTVVGCGVPLCVAIYVGVTSWVRMRRLARGRPGLTLWGMGISEGWSVGFWAIVGMGWLTTEGTLGHYARQTGYFDYRRITLVEELETLDQAALTARFKGITDYPKTDDLAYLARRELETRWWMQTWLPDLLVPAQLAGTVFVQTPPGWLDHDQARRAFWLQECKAEGLTPSLCGDQTDPWGEIPGNLQVMREKWCAKTLGLIDTDLATPCRGFFRDLSSRIAEDWKIARRNALNDLPKRDLSAFDLRWAILNGAQLAGADMSLARMEGANLIQARMEGSDLSDAQMEEAAMIEARLEGANLFLARLKNAILIGAQMEGADLRGAQMEGADLGGARMQGADLNWAGINRVRFLRSDLSKTTDLTPDQLRTAFGDGSVTLPGGVGPDSADWPAHWPKGELDFFDYIDEYTKWLASPSTYTPPPP